MKYCQNSVKVTIHKGVILPVRKNGWQVHTSVIIPSAFLELFSEVRLYAVFSSFSGQGACALLQECNNAEFLLECHDCCPSDQLIQYLPVT